MEKAEKYDTKATARPDMRESVWRNFPEEIFMNVMVFLPLQSLLRFCTVSKLWNAIPKDPKFHEIRDTCSLEFMKEVLGCSKFRMNCHLKSCTKGFFLMTSCVYDIYVIRPSKLSLRQIPRPDWSLDAQRFDIKLIGMVVDERVRDYVFIVSSRLRYTSEGAREYDGRSRRPWEVDEAINLHHFKSNTGLWSWCGNGGMTLHCSIPLKGVTLHRDRLLVFVMHDYRYQVQCYNGAGAWETLLGNFPLSGRTIPLPVLYDHKGKLQLAVPHSNGCSLWEYRDDSSEWSSTNILPKVGFCGSGMDRQYVNDVTLCYASFAGDFLYFGKLCHTGKTFLCCRMKYNLISRELERVSLKEQDRIVVRNSRSNRPFHLEPV